MNGLFLLLLPLPWLVALGCDSWGWQKLLLAHSGARASLRSLFCARLSGEAAGACLPSGSLVADAVAFATLSPGPSSSSLLGTLAVRRFLVIQAHGLSLLLAALLLFGSGGVARGRAFVLMAGAAVLFLAAWALAVACGRGAPVGEMRAALSRLPFRRLRAALLSRSAGPIEADQGLAVAFAGLRGRHLRQLAPFLGVFLMEAVETWMILRGLGAPAALSDVLTFEGTVSLLRASAFFLPSGAVVQDAGYVGALLALGWPGALALGASLAAWKRTREVLFTGAGLVWLSVFLGNRARVEHSPTRALHLRLPEPDHADARGGP